MAKKKRKTFQKSQLLSLFQNKNYQKVISKIKQFEIEGMGVEELQKIQLDSYEQLAKANFELGDINRALRDIESLLTIENSEAYRLIKLKYLCYMEHFKDAVVFAEDLIESKDLKIKKEALFLYLLANIYNGNYEIDEKSLKPLPKARQNYILAFNAFSQGDREKALSFFDACNPRNKVEKENVKAIKSILLNQESISSETLKPLYRFLIDGEDSNLQNTKSSRAIKKEILSQFSQNRQKREIESLISLKSSIPVETILKEVKEKDSQTRLIYNNIVLLIEKQKNLTKALELFIKHRNSLIQFVESGMLLIQLKSLVEDKKSDKLMVNFFSSYLKIHHKKLSEFQLDFIFIFLFKTLETEGAIKLIEQYGGEDILFLFKNITLMDKVEASDKERFNKIMKKYSFLKGKALEGLSQFMDVFDENMDKVSQIEKRLLREQLSQILILFSSCDKAHKKYQSTIFEIFSSMARVVQNFEFSTNRALFIQLSETINNFIEIYNVDKSDVSSDIKTLFTSIEQKRSIKKEKNTEDEHFLDIFKDMLNDYDENDLDADFLNEDSLDEHDLEKIKEDFIEALKNKQNPFTYVLEELEENFYNDTLFEFILDLTSKAIEFDRYDKNFTQIFLDMMNITPEDSHFREDLMVSVKIYAKKDVRTAILFLYDVITLTPKKDRETVWYLKWLETYLYLVDDYAMPKTEVFKAILHHFIRVQQKKRFKTLNGRFEKLIDRFKDKGLF